jgi:hypothetical protein
MDLPRASYGYTGHGSGFTRGYVVYKVFTRHHKASQGLPTFETEVEVLSLAQPPLIKSEI